MNYKNIKANTVNKKIYMLLLTTISDIISIAHYKNIHKKETSQDDLKYRLYEDGEITKVFKDDIEEVLYTPLKKSYFYNFKLKLPNKHKVEGKIYTYAILTKKECIHYRKMFNNLLNNMMMAKL